jgi:transcriptional antiterminator NusG
MSTQQITERQVTETSTKHWCVLKVASNKEDQVRDTLERKVKAENLTDIIGRLLVPRERVKKVKAGQQKVAENKTYPGYVFVEMELNSDGTIPERAWYVFKETAGAGDFIGHKNKPDRMAAKEVEKLIADAEKPEAGPAVKVEFLKGDGVKVREGPFENFEGVVDEIFPDKGMVRVIVTIFGRATPLELEYWQLEKVQ